MLLGLVIELITQDITITRKNYIKKTQDIFAIQFFSTIISLNLLQNSCFLS